MSIARADREVVLWGVGHTNAHVLRMWRMRPIPGARLTCVSNTSVATYSGMLPGVLAGQDPPERMEIDLVRLCASAGARLIQAEVCGLDRHARELQFEDRPPLPFDALSIGIGSVPAMDGLEAGHDHVIAIKPMTSFLDRLERKIAGAGSSIEGRPLRLAVVGGGAGGVEIAFTVEGFANRVLRGRPVAISLVHSGDEVAAGSSVRTNRRVHRRLVERGVTLHLGRGVRRWEEGLLTLSGGDPIEADVVIWATGASAPPILTALGLPVDARGFLLTRPTLQIVEDLPIFAVGDSGTSVESPTAKSGVFAVRQGPVLWRNLANVLAGRPLESYRPQRAFLKLLNTGDGRAIGEYRGLSLDGRWCRRLKNFIDGRFMDRYQDYSMMSVGRGMAKAPMPEMRCTGCGGKIGGAVLSRALKRLSPPSGAGVLVGLDSPDDAAVVLPPEGRPLALTVDFFAAPLDDAYLVGRLSALHAASDCFAMNASPRWALAMATLPVASPRSQEQVLYEWLAGSLREFSPMGVSLVGGHTIEGPQFTVGFTLIASADDGPLRVKGGFRAGDHLILTKPLGSGILLAAHARALCRAPWMDALVRSMLASNRDALALLPDFDIRGLTDITGFGLAGHLLEALRASGLDARLDLDAVPLLPGVAELVGQGIESTLAPSNRSAEAAIEATPDQRDSPAFAALFDPQTCGGLLLGAAEEDAPRVLARLAELGVTLCAVIGQLGQSASSSPRIHITERPGQRLAATHPSRISTC